MEENGKKEGQERREREEVYSVSVRAGKRTYFFDVKETKKGEYYLTITESRKRFSDEGEPYYEKHKLFLYKEDFDNFAQGFTQSTGYIKEKQPETTDAEGMHSQKYKDEKNNVKETTGNEKTDEKFNPDKIEFEDLGEEDK